MSRCILSFVNREAIHRAWLFGMVGAKSVLLPQADPEILERYLDSRPECISRDFTFFTPEKPWEDLAEAYGMDVSKAPIEFYSLEYSELVNAVSVYQRMVHFHKN